MAIIKISELPAADSPVSPSDVAPFLQNGVTKQASIDQFGFLPAGANAVTRTIQNKLRDIVSVMDFGAVGDGVTDDSAAIQSAVSSLSANGGEVYIPPGTYCVASPILVPAKVVVRGAGIGVTFLSATTAMTNLQAVFYAATANTVEFQDFSILGNTNGTLGAGTGIHVKSGSGAKIQRVYISNTTQAGIRLDEVDTALVEDCWLESCGRTGYTDNHGIMLYTTTAASCSGVKIVRNRVKQAFRKGITTFTGVSTGSISDVLIDGNTVEGCGLGNIYVGGPLQSRIVITNNDMYGGYVNLQFGDASDSVVANNTATLSTAFNFGLYGVSNSVIKGNVLRTSGEAGIATKQAVTEVCVGLVISDNVVYNSNRLNAGQAAIDLVATSDTVIANNIVYDATGLSEAEYGVYERSTCDKNTVVNNRVFNMATADYSVTGANSTVVQSKLGTVFAVQSGLQVNHTSLTLVNGANNNVALPANAGAVTITGPTGVFNITGIAGGVLGRMVTLVNSTAHVMTLTINSGSSTAGNRLYLTGGVDKAIAAYSAVTLMYVTNQGSNFWMDI